MMAPSWELTTMAKTLNPHATPAPMIHAAEPAPPDPPRRHLLVASLAAIVGTLVGLFPVGAGALVFLDPILKRKKAGGNAGEGRPLRRVASMDAIPADGTPVQVPV